MTARKGARKAAGATPPAPAAEGPATESPTDVQSAGAPVELSKRVDGDEPDPAAEVQLAQSSETKPSPVKRYQAPRKALYRAGGHVLTERGWELDRGQES